MLEAAGRATGDAMAMLDAAGRILCANRAYQELLGMEQDGLRKLDSREFEARGRERFRELDGPAARYGIVPAGAAVVETAGGGTVAESRLYYRSTVAVRDSEGREVGSLMVYRDVYLAIRIEQLLAGVQDLREAPAESPPDAAGMVGTSAGMRRVYALMTRAAQSDVTVLVRGETGTGKELVAKSLHGGSARRGGPFVAVDCAAIPEALIESELFGHERGAFTGAAMRRMGAFERAQGGTILLDEIGDMSHPLQAKLLRVLQERKLQRVGGNASISVDIRVVAATNKDLHREVEAGQFRKDLYFRVAGFPILIPPLRQRREDIPLLARHFLDRYVADTGKAIGGISSAAMLLLTQYDWPGNVRELGNVIERAVLLERSSVLRASNLPGWISPLLGDAGADRSQAPAVLPLAETERRALLHALEVSGRNVTRAARALGINRATLHRKLKTYDLASR